MITRVSEGRTQPDGAARGGSFPPRGGSVLVVRLSALGDVLFALETVTALHEARPDLHIDFLVEPGHGHVLDGHPQIREVLRYPRQHRLRVPGFLWKLRRRRWDLVLDLHGLQKSALCVRAVRATRKLGFAPPGAREGAHRAYTEAVPLPLSPSGALPHRAARGFYLLEHLGLIQHVDDASPQAAPALDLRPPERSPWEGEGPRVVLHPGASAFAAFKRWPEDRFAALARALTADGCQVLVSFGPGEAELARRIVAEAPGARELDGTALGLLGLGAVYRDADVAVAADTGPLHLAAAAGTTVVALFGPKDHALYGPRGSNDHTVLYRDVPCRPCKRRTCAAPLCIRGLEVEDVLDAVRATLATADRP